MSGAATSAVKTTCLRMRGADICPLAAPRPSPAACGELWATAAWSLGKRPSSCSSASANSSAHNFVSQPTCSKPQHLRKAVVCPELCLTADLQQATAVMICCVPTRLCGSPPAARRGRFMWACCLEACSHAVMAVGLAGTPPLQTAVQSRCASDMAHLRSSTACPDRMRFRTGTPQLQQMLLLARHSLAVHCSAWAMAQSPCVLCNSSKR